MTSLPMMALAAALLAAPPVPEPDLPVAAAAAPAAPLPSLVALPAGWEARRLGADGSAYAPAAVSRPPRRDRFFAEDKLMHFFTSFAATTLAGSGARVVGFDARDSRRLGVAAGAVVGIGKEIYDLGRPGETASVLDLIWDAGGVALAAAVARQQR